MEKGLSGQVAKKRSWVKGCFQVEDDHLFRKPNKPDAKRREVISLPELFDKVAHAHESLGHVGQDATAKYVLSQYYGISKMEMSNLST